MVRVHSGLPFISLNLLAQLRRQLHEPKPRMNTVFRNARAAILLIGLTAAASGTDTTSLLEFEKRGIDRISQFSATEHSAILFTVADRLVGFAKDGQIHWINSGDISHTRACGWPHPALSHDGLRVAFVTDSDRPKHCRIAIEDMPTGTQRELIETGGDPGEISWSWNDAEIVFLDGGISAVSVGEGRKRALLPFPMKRIGNLRFSFWVWYPMQWLHNGDLVLELNTEIPTKEPGTYQEQSNLLVVSGGDSRLLDVGSQPAVSPSSDRIAYYGRDGIVSINPDGTQRIVLAKNPRTIAFLKEELFGRLVWSPDGKRLVFGTIVSENRADNLYLLNLKSGSSEQFLSHTSITIRGWN
jgi:hypothetical protein